MIMHSPQSSPFRFAVLLGCLALLILTPAPSRAGSAQGKKRNRKGSFFLSWGYNRSGYSSSDIHFTGPDYDFTLHDISAVDRPTPLSAEIYLNPSQLSIPQYVGRVGYFFNERTSISLVFSHLKYIAVQNQRTRISGRIGAEGSEDFAGEYENTPITMEESFLRFEHTNGLNYLSLELERLFPLWLNSGRSIGLFATVGGGGGVVVPVSDVTLFNTRRINQAHLAGYGFSSNLGLRLEFLDRLFLQGYGSGGYMNLPSILTRSGGGSDRASQYLFFREGAVVMGVRLFRLH